MSEAPTTFSYAVLNLPGDVWITVEPGSAIPAKYCGMATVSYPNGFGGYAVASMKFNLTAYVQDMIKEALPSPPRPSVGR